MLLRNCIYRSSPVASASGASAGSTSPTAYSCCAFGAIHSKIVYDDRLLKLAGIRREKRPDRERAVDILSPIKPGSARALGLNENIPVVKGTPELDFAAIGGDAAQGFEPHVYTRTF